MNHVIRASAALTVGLVALLSLAGCIDTPPKPTNSPTTPATSSTPTSSPTPAATATPTPVTLPCTTILTAQQVYNYNPNYVAQDSYTPTAGTDAAAVVADSGVACGWVDETSGSILSVAIAKPAAAELATRKASAASGSSAISVGSGATGYFSASGGVGELQVFTSTDWIVISSADFSVKGDASPTAQVVLLNLKAG